MGKIYKNQTAIKFIADTDIDLTLSTNKKIKFIKPESLATGSWIATGEGNPTGGLISYTVNYATTIDEAGEWKLWSWVEFNDGRSAPGEAYNQMIFEEGE